MTDDPRPLLPRSRLPDADTLQQLNGLFRQASDARRAEHERRPAEAHLDQYSRRSIDVATSVYACWLHRLLNWLKRHPGESVTRLPHEQNCTRDELNMDGAADAFLLQCQTTAYLESLAALDRQQPSKPRADDSFGCNAVLPPLGER
jgi:hypothetical protein